MDKELCKKYGLSCKRIDIPDKSIRPHLGTVKEAWNINNTYKVLVAKTKKYIHLRIRRLDDKPICEYMIFQNIKNVFLGEEVEAIQVFPKVSNYVDNTNTYHIFSWEGIETPNLKELYQYPK